MIVAVPAVAREWHDGKRKLMSRTMLPLRLAFAIAFHKSQGMTIERVAINLGDAESHVGGTFTTLTRVPGFGNLALEGSTNHDRLGRMNHSKAIATRKEYEVRKWRPRGNSAQALCSIAQGGWGGLFAD